MNEFDRRWQTGAARAREAQPPEPVEASPGFAHRVVARARVATAPATPWELICERFTWRALACAGVVLVASVLLDPPSAPESESFLPAVETVTPNLFWTT